MLSKFRGRYQESGEKRPRTFNSFGNIISKVKGRRTRKRWKSELDVRLFDKHFYKKVEWRFPTKKDLTTNLLKFTNQKFQVVDWTRWCVNC